jgi:hypothetical protein
MLKKYTVFVDPKRMAELEKLAEKMELKTAQLVRFAIKEYLEKHGK